MIGRGINSIIYEAINKKDKIKYAIKIYMSTNVEDLKKFEL